MKVLLYSQNNRWLEKSSFTRAFSHIKSALDAAQIDYTLDPNDAFDVVHVNTTFPKSYNFMRRMQKRGYPVIVHGHSTPNDFKNSFAGYKLMAPFFNYNLKRIYGRADLIITPTPYSKGLIEHIPQVSCPVVAISNGIELDKYAYNDEAVKAFQKHLHLKGSEKIVISAGLLFVRKGLPDFIEIARSMPGVTFIWFGELTRSLMSKEIKTAIDSRPANVIMPGYVPSKVIRGGFMKADAFFFPTYEENEGIVVLEALAAHTPVITRDIPVYEGWLINDKHAIKATGNEAFKQAITRVLSTDMTTMTEAGYKLAQERSLKEIGKQLEETYQIVLKNHKASH